MTDRRIAILAIVLFVSTVFLFIRCDKTSASTKDKAVTTQVDPNELNTILTRLTPKNVIDISLDDSGKLTYVKKISSTENTPLEKPKETICEGYGKEFAKHISKELDNGKTLKLYKINNLYIAEEV